jgi:uncharacterized protein YegP (UPF0339 family)
MATQREVKKQDRGVLINAYASRFGEPEDEQEAHGYWMFAAGLVFGLLGLFVLAFSTMSEPGSSAAFSGRQIAGILGGVGLPLLMLGIVYRLPIKKAADRVALVGALVCLIGIAAFVVYYPGNWNVPSGSSAADYAVIITGAYGVGLLIIGFAALVMPSMVGRERTSDIEEREDDAFEREGAISGREEAVSKREEDVEEREKAVSEREKEVEEHDEVVSEREAVLAQKEAADDDSKATFTMFQDKAGEWRWNLRHQNGNIIADSAEGYSSKAKAKQGLDSVRKNVPGAPITEREDETDGDATDAGAVAAAEEDEEVGAEYELYEDAAGEWRWRLIAANGEIIADCGQGYGDRRDAEAGIETVRGKAGDADHLEITPAGFEVYRDEADEWRWRLIRQNGLIIADSGGGYTERSSAMEAVERVQSLSGETEVYEDEGGEWRWRHTASNGQIIADSGEGYSTEGAAEEAAENLESVVPEADTVEKGEAYFTVYKDNAEEWRWRLVASNGNIVADSGEGYTERNDAVEALERVKEYSTAPTA